MKLALLGAGLQHSLSPLIHQKWIAEYHLSGSYELCELPWTWEPKNFHDLLKERQYEGCNITMPYKRHLIPFMDQVDEAVSYTSSINTIKVMPSGKLSAINSDVKGFLDLIKGCSFKKGIILGTGGSAQAILYALHCRGVPHVTLVTRTLTGDFGPQETQYSNTSSILHRCGWGEDLFKELAEADLIVNATPRGMKGFPALSLPLELVSKEAVILDLVYDPLVTPLIKEARQRSLRTINGFDFLLAQARHSFHFWFGLMPGSYPSISYPATLEG